MRLMQTLPLLHVYMTGSYSIAPCLGTVFVLPADHCSYFTPPPLAPCAAQAMLSNVS